MTMELAVPDGFKPEKYPALILNADWKPVGYLPLSVANWKDAVEAVLKDAVTVVREHDVEIHSQFLTMKLPSVIATKKFIKRRMVPSLSRQNLIVLRDRWACAYCGGKFDMDSLTFDHVIPKSKGGQTRWQNLVSCCEECNQLKGDRTPEAARMKLLWRPWLPSVEQLARADFFLHKRKLLPGWEEFLPFGESVGAEEGGPPSSSKQ